MRRAKDLFDAHSTSRDGARKFLQTSANAKRSEFPLELCNQRYSHILAKISTIWRQCCMLVGAGK